MLTDQKTCTGCEEDKPLTEFPKCGGGRRRANCRGCVKHYRDNYESIPANRARKTQTTRASHVRNRSRNRVRWERWRDAHPEWKIAYDRERQLARYGLTLDDFADMLEAQAGTCAICQEIFEETPHVDHCHQTQKVRGLLCKSCNNGLGRFRDDTARLRAAVAYLEGGG